MSKIIPTLKNIKDLPKKSTLINNLLKREDDFLLEVKLSKESNILIQLVKKDGYRHVLANKELLALLNKDELFSLLQFDKINKDIYYSSFKFETYVPTNEESKTKTKVTS